MASETYGDTPACALFFITLFSPLPVYKKYRLQTKKLSGKQCDVMVDVMLSKLWKTSSSLGNSFVNISQHFKLRYRKDIIYQIVIRFL